MSIQIGFQPEDFDMKTLRAAAAEFVATGMFVFLGTSSVIAATAGARLAGGDGLPGPAAIVSIALAHGLAFALAVSVTAHISGGHINPAVSFAAALTGKMKVSSAVLYIAGQVLAAVLAVLLLKAVLAGPIEQGLGAHGIAAFDPNIGGPGLLDEQVADGAGAGLLLEIALTFVLVFVIFATAMDPKGPAHLAPMAIGLAVLVIHLVAIPMTGASVNPARSFGPAMVANIWDDHWVYWLGPLIGAGIAGLVYEYVFMVRGDEEAMSAPSPPPENA